MIGDPTKLRSWSNPGDNRARSDADGNGNGLLDAIFIPFLIIQNRMRSLHFRDALLISNRVAGLI